MIDIGNDNLDNELNIEKYNMKMLKFRGSNNNVKHSILLEDMIIKNGELIDLRTKEEINYEKKVFMNNKNNPKELEYWRNIFPTKTDNELEEYRVRWSKENPKYLKFERL